MSQHPRFLCLRPTLILYSFRVSPKLAERGEEKVRKLERENTRLEKELDKAHLIIDVQGKIAGLLGLSLEDGAHS